MRTPKYLIAFALAVAVALVPTQSAAQTQDSFAGFSGAVSGVGSAPCFLIKYVGTTAGKPEVTVAAGGDLTLAIATVADVTTGSASNGIFDLSTPAAADDTWGEVINRINTQGSNWKAVLVSCLASNLTDNTADTLAATDASAPGGVAVNRVADIASNTAIFSGQVALLPEDAATNIQFHLSGRRINPNPLSAHQLFVNHIREKITSAGVIALFEVLGVKRTYDSTGRVTEVVRTLYAQTGAATTVEAVLNFHPGPIPAAKGEWVIVRQSTATGLTVLSINGSGFAKVNR